MILYVQCNIYSSVTQVVLFAREFLFMFRTRSNRIMWLIRLFLYQNYYLIYNLNQWPSTLFYSQIPLSIVTSKRNPLPPALFVYC